MQNPPDDERRGTTMAGAAVTPSSANERGKEKNETLWQRGVNFVSSNLSPLLVGAGISLAGVYLMGLSVNAPFRPSSAERLSRGDKGMAARRPSAAPFVHFVRCSSQFF